MASRAQWKTWFGTGKKPLATQFADVFDGLFKPDEDTLPISKVQNLSATLASKADAYQLDSLNTTVTLAAGTDHWDAPAGVLLEKLLIIAPTNINFRVGTTVGGQEIIESYDIVSSSVYAKDVYFPLATTIYFGGVAGDTIIKIFKR